MIKDKKLSEIIKIVFLAKTILIISSFIFYLGWIEIGERSLSAQNKASKKNLKDEGDETQLLQSLLNLPPLNEEKATKDEISRYLIMIEQIKQRITDKSEILKMKISQLKKLEENIDVKINKLEEERLFFKSTIQKEKKIQEDRAQTLVELYEKMEPKKAAPVFETMDKDLVINLFQKMKKKQVTKILESMQTDKSVMISEYFGRVGSAREYDILKEMNKSLKQAFDDCKKIPE